jgi:hypothetical protein
MTVRYPIRDHRGTIIALHDRVPDSVGGKRFEWRQPDGSLGLNGTPTAALPLYGSQRAAAWDVTKPVIVTEGEKAASALVKADWQAVGTVTGASGCPGDEALSVLAGMHVVLWPDNDKAGGMHMLKIARALEGIAAPVGWVVVPDAAPGDDAYDALQAGLNIAELVQAASDVPRQEPPAPPRSAPREPQGESPIAAFNAAVSVTDVLAREYGLAARPGSAVRCPLHDDRHPSLSILRDDRRVYCHSPSCLLNNEGHGRDAYDLWRLADEGAA